MTTLKRPYEALDATTSDIAMHPSRKRRFEYTEADAQLAKLYNDLADDVQEIRVKAASDLIRNLAATNPEQRVDRINTAVGRLIKGVCSGRKAARWGFSVALDEVLRLGFALKDEAFRLQGVLFRVAELTTVQGNVSGQERRDCLLGRRSAYQAILQSDVAANSSVSMVEWKTFVGAVLELMSEKAWLRRECGFMLYHYLENSKVQVPAERLQVFVDGFSAAGLWKTPEGVALWLLFAKKFEDVQLPKNVWQKNDPLSMNERILLSKVMQEVPIDEDQSQANGKTASGTRMAAPSFAWAVILKDACDSPQSENDVPLIWKRVVDDGLFAATSSPERKALGLQVFTLALPLVDPTQTKDLFSPNLIRCIISQRANAQNYLFDAAKVPLSQMIAHQKREPRATAGMVQGLIKSGAINFDQLTKTKVVETLLANAPERALTKVVRMLRDIMDKPEVITGEPAQVDTQRRLVADMLLSMVRSRSPAEIYIKHPDGRTGEPPEWVSRVLNMLLEAGFCKPQKSLSIAPMSDASRAICRQRLSSCIGQFMNLPLVDAAASVYDIVKWLRGAKNTYYYKSASSEAKDIVKRTDKALRDSSERQWSDRSQAHRDSASAFTLLYAMSVYQVYNDEPDAVSALEDLHACAGDWGKNTESAAVLIELLLSFASKQSALFRKLAEQVFSAFSSSLEPEGLRSMLDVLEQKESLSGQDELFKNGDEEEDGDDSNEDDQSAIDVDDMSDVEMVNGEQADLDSSDAEAGDQDSDDSSEEEDEEELAAFDAKLAAALGPAKVNDEGGEEDSDSDMDDEQMMAIEPALQNVFKELKKKAGKKQDNKDAKDNIVNFKNRVLDLLAIYVKSQYSNLLAMDLIMPLTILTRTTTNKPTAEKAFAVLKQYFDGCTKHKSVPALDSGNEDVMSLLESIHEEMAKDGSKLHANACSRSALFVARVLCNFNADDYEDIAESYAKLQSQWWLDPKSKIHSSVFTEWTSWSIATRAART